MLRLLLCIELKLAIHLTEDIATVTIPYYSDISSLAGSDTQVRNVSLKRVEDASRIAYISPIALQQSIHKGVQPECLANQFIQNLFQIKSEAKTSSWLTAIDLKSFLVKVIPPGFIWFELSDRGTAAWLQHLINPFPHSDYSVDRCIAPLNPIAISTQMLPQKQADTLFAVQHIHARCCSLLRLADEQGKITIAPSKTPSEFEQILHPSPIPWFREVPQRLPTSQAPFCLVHPSEMALVSQLFSLLDLLCSAHELEACGVQARYPSQTVWFKQLDRVNQAFHTFHRHCRIWEEAERDLPLAQARLGLLAATRTILQLVLENALGSVAPSIL
jgi:hypothetical protein